MGAAVTAEQEGDTVGELDWASVSWAQGDVGLSGTGGTHGESRCHRGGPAAVRPTESWAAQKGWEAKETQEVPGVTWARG